MSTNPTEATARPVTTPSPTEARGSLVLRVFAGICAIGLLLAITFLFALAVIGWVPIARAVFTPLITNSSSEFSGVAVGMTTAVLLLVPIVAFTWLVRRHRLAWGWLALGWAAVIPVYFWLAWDEPAIRRPLKIEEISPTFPGAERSYEVLMRYSSLTPSAEAKAFTQFKSTLARTSQGPRDAEKWVEFLIANRAAVEAEWTALAPQRQWLAELNAFDRIGDLTVARLDANVIQFNAWRTLARSAVAIACLQAIDGHGDEAIATLMPYFEISRKLEVSSRTLIRSLTARTVLRWSVDAANFILDRQPVSPATRARLGAALAGGSSGAGARRLILIEYPTFASVVAALNLAERSLSERNWLLRGPLALLSRFIVNPVATVNRYGEFLYDLAALAEARAIGKLAVRSLDFAHAFIRHPGPKNLGGGAILNLATPSFEKLIRSYWETEDLRVALYARVTNPRS